MNRRFIVPIMAVVSAGVIVPGIGCGAPQVDVVEVKLPEPVAVEVAAPPLPAPAAPPAVPVATGNTTLKGRRVMIPGELEFDSGKATLKQNPKTKECLGELVAFIKANRQITKLEVQGHTDNIGPEDLNQKLSQARAEAVAAALVAAGIDPRRIASKGYGSTVDYKDHGGKVIPNDTAAHRAMNRRVEYHVLQLDGQDWTEPAEDAARPGSSRQ
jgi:outer membrane protein OmpA-like peptidoglycan-associated protein